MGARRYARPPARAGRRSRWDSRPGLAAAAGGRPERTRNPPDARGAVRAALPGSEKNPIPGSGGPFLEQLLSLMSFHRQLAKAVHGNVQRQEMFDDAGKEVDAAAHEAVFVEFEFDAHAAHEGNAVLADDASETAFPDRKSTRLNS